MTNQEIKDQIEKKLRTQVQVELFGIQARILYSAITGIDGSKKLAEILVEEAEKIKAQLNTEV